jgi:hypothetical protein
MLPTGSILSRFVMLRHGKQAAFKDSEIYSDGLGGAARRPFLHDTAARSQRLCALQLELSTASGLR